MSAITSRRVAAVALSVGGALAICASKKYVNVLKTDVSNPNFENRNESQEQTKEKIKESTMSKKLQQKKIKDTMRIEAVSIFQPLELWRYVPLKASGDNYLHYFNSQPPSHRDHRVAIQIPYLKQHPKYAKILKYHNLQIIPSNKPDGIEIITFDKAVEGEAIGDNALVKKAAKLIELDKRLKNGEKLKKTEWRPMSKEEKEKEDAKINSMFVKIPK